MFPSVAAFCRSVPSCAGRTTADLPAGLPGAWGGTGAGTGCGARRKTRIPRPWGASLYGHTGSPAEHPCAPATQSHPRTWRGHLHPGSLEEHAASPTLSSSGGCREVSFLCSTSCVRDTEFRPQILFFFFLHRPANSHHLGTMRAVRTGEGSRPNCERGLESRWKERKHSSGKFCPEKNQTSLAENECSVY